MERCLICSSLLSESVLRPDSGWTVTNCPRCGSWGFQTSLEIVENLLESELGNWDARSVHLSGLAPVSWTGEVLGSGYLV
jgi:hypothetical protein